MKTSTTWLTRKRDGDSIKSRVETCRQIRHRHRIGIKPIGRRAIGILQDLTSGVFLKFGSFCCLEKHLQPTDGRCKQYTNKHSTYRGAQHDHANTRGSSRLHAPLRICETVVIHVSCRTCPCLFPSSFPIFSIDFTDTHNTFGAR